MHVAEPMVEVLGATWMLGRNVIFDTQTSRLGIADAACPSDRVAHADQTWRVDDNNSSTEGFSERPPGPTKSVSVGGASSQGLVWAFESWRALSWQVAQAKVSLRPCRLYIPASD